MGVFLTGQTFSKRSSIKVLSSMIAGFQFLFCYFPGTLTTLMLLAAHDHAHRVGSQLSRAQKDVSVEYERNGKASGLSFDDWLGRSHSIVAEVYRDKQKLMGITMGNVITALAECDTAKDEIELDVHRLKLEFADAIMHCRRISQEEYEQLDVRVKAEVLSSESNLVVVPAASVGCLAVKRKPGEFGHLQALIDQGCHTFVGVSCPVDAVTLAKCITLKQNPCLLPRLGLKKQRSGLHLKTLFLADNGLGPHGLDTIANGMQHSGLLSVFHCIDNDIGEDGKIDDENDQERTASLSGLDRIAAALKMAGSTIRILNLSGNNIGPAGAACLAKGLAGSQVLELLDVSSNVFGVAGANHIAVALTQNRSLQVLNVNSTQIARSGLRALLSALAYNSTLSILFALHTVGPSALGELDYMLRGNFTLQAVHLYQATPWMNPQFHHGQSETSSNKAELHAAEKSQVGPVVEWRSVPGDNFRLGFFPKSQSKKSMEDGLLASHNDIALQLEQKQNRMEKARKNIAGISTETALQRINQRSLGNQEVVQGWGPLLNLGVNMPTAAQIIGYRAGGVDKSNLNCEWCKNEKWKAGVGEFGHEAFECPRRCEVVALILIF